ncbi:amidinotransferase [Psychroflexus sp. CAK57W]|uniref:citrulline utilization hydrolase CtlX n=1 Tax=Psychroflexus curvus TaxID=2873595 RepID=UPI001CCF88B6|nr:arginine deiminase-related protein [Psychroflexus curvus]MBZ9628085.1 amidinotransferase [Psychroflexus curvus]MBZ9787784.1 amidinotransferase [Psychroflexus curvus]
MKQITDTLVMIRPVNFRMNEETAVNNYFQKTTEDLQETVNKKAQAEFDAFADKLKSVGVHVIVIDDIASQDSPDSIFPNNWVSFHENGDVALYPMFAKNRRVERREDIFEKIEAEGRFIRNFVDYTSAELENVFLEGTGSLILDRQNRKAYCALSPRADEDLIIEFCEDFEYTPIIFNAYQSHEGERLPIYHTNVMMCVAEEFAVICLDTIDDKKELKLVADSLAQDGKEIISISEEQMNNFAGNMLQVQGETEKFLVMSKAAHDSLTEKQIQSIEKHCKILSSDLTTIETHGGGSARCMLAEVFIPKAE